MALAVPAALDRRPMRALLMGGAAVLAGLAAAWVASRIGAVETFALLLAIPLGALALRSVWVSFGAILAVITLAPFVVLPVAIGEANPTLFEIVTLAAVVSYGAILMLDRSQRLYLSTPLVAWFVLAGYLVFAFMFGARFGLTNDLLRLFGRFGLALMLFWLTIQLVRERHDGRRLVLLLVAGAALAAGVALALYAGGTSFTFRMLLKLVPYGYPDTRVVRFIEDNPANPMRAVGTGVDPNAFGGLVMVGFILAVGLAFSRRPLAPRSLAWAAVGLTGLAVLLTYSRGAWLGSALGAGIIVWFRARALMPLALVSAFAAALAGVGMGFLIRLEAGLRFQDAATRQRLNEYDNALAIIREHPWFGIGFGDAPSPEFGVGVSSIYLLIAEQTGLLGLSFFLLVVAMLAARGLRAFRATDDDLVLACGATLAAILTVGLVDHYFFNIRFVHMVALFWILAGLMVAITEERFAGT
jgi:O-antigen ligase